MREHADKLIILAALVLVAVLFWQTKDASLRDILLMLTGGLVGVSTPKAATK